MLDKLNLSLFHTILVLVEDHTEVSMEELHLLGSPRQTLGALGRLEGLGYVERIKSPTPGKDKVVLTDKGDEVLSDILDFIPDPAMRWDGKWRLVLFDIPESKRTVRQMFRLKLMDLGARMFQSSVWVTPHSKIIDKFDTVIQTMGYSESVHYFEAETIHSQDLDVSKLWQLNVLHKEYRDLFKTFDQSSARLKKEQNASFYAKCMIVALALTAKKDPHLTSEMMPAQWAGKDVAQWHKTLRQYCTN